MSEFIKAKTCIKAEHMDCLAKALEDVVPQWKGHIEMHGKPVHLYGYHDDERPEVAHIVINRCYVSNASNDIGFVAKADGTVEAIISQFDRTKSGSNFGGDWTDRLTQHYAYRVAEKQAAKLGATISKTVNPDGTWRVVLTKPETKAWAKAGAGRAW